VVKYQHCYSVLRAVGQGEAGGLIGRPPEP